MKKTLAALWAASALLVTSCGEVVGPDRAQPLNHAPSVSASGPATAEPGATITVAAVASDADGDALTFVWDSNEPTDAIANPAAPTTAATLGQVESTRTFRVQVSDGDIMVTAQLFTVVDRDSVPPPPPDCVRQPASFTDGDDPNYIVANHPLASFYGAYGENGVDPVTVTGVAIGDGWYQFDLSAYLGYERFSWHQKPVDWSASPEERAEMGCWAIVESTVLDGSEVFRKRFDPDGASFEWKVEEPPEPCSMRPLGSADWEDDTTTVTVVADHQFWSFYDAYARETEPAVTLVGTPAGSGWWEFEVAVDLFDRLPRSNFHQRAVNWSLSRDERAAMGCWADLLRSVLPPDCPFAVRSDPDGMSLEYVGSTDVPDPVAGFLFLDLRGVYYLSNFEFWSFYGAGPLETVASTTVIEGLYGFLIAAVDAAAALNPQSNLHTRPLFNAPDNVWAQLSGDEVWVAPRTRFEVAGDHLERN